MGAGDVHPDVESQWQQAPGNGEEMAVWKQMRHQTGLLGAIGAVVAILLLAGCSSGTRITSQSASPNPHTKTYANRQFGFAISYDASRLTESVDTVDSGRGTYSGPPPIPVDSILIDVLVKPAKDVQTAWDGPGGVQVSVERASRPITLPTLAGLRRSSKKYFLGDPLVPLASLHIAGLVVGQWQPFSLKGLRGFAIAYLTKGSHQVIYGLWNGKHFYVFQVGASKRAWPQIAATLTAVVQSLQVIQ